MTTLINADTINGGAVITADNSGELALQAAGVTKLTVNSSGVTLANALPIASGGTGTTATQFVNLASNVTGTLPIANGGTGSTSTQFVSLGTNVTGTLPIANGGTGSTSTQFVNLASNVTGTLPVANGGTGAASLTANNVLLGNGTSALQVVAPGSSGNVLTSNGTTWQSTAPSGVSLSTANTWTATQTFNGLEFYTFGAKFNSAKETCKISAAAGGTLNIYACENNVVYYTANATSNWQVLFYGGQSSPYLNTHMSVGEAVTVAIMVTNGSSAFFATGMQIDDVSVTPIWQGGTAPTSGNANSTDVYTYTIVKTSATPTWKVFASVTKFA